MFRGTCHHLIEELERIYSRFIHNVKTAKPTFSTRRDAIGTTAWECAICHLFENLLPAASYSRRVSDLKVPNKRMIHGSTFVEQQMLQLLFNKCWTVYHVMLNVEICRSTCWKLLNVVERKYSPYPLIRTYFFRFSLNGFLCKWCLVEF